MLTKMLIAALAIICILIVLGTHVLQYADQVDLRALAFSILPTTIKTSTDASVAGASASGASVPQQREGMTNDVSTPDKKSVHEASPSSELNTSPKDAFCTSTPNDKSELERKCGKLTRNTCKDMDCCVLLNGSKCVTGDKYGPTFADDKPEAKAGDDYRYYKKACFGKCPDK